MLVFLLVWALGLPSTQGNVVYYSESWGAWTCPAAEHCGIAARQNVTVPPGMTAIATPNCADLNRTGFLSLNGSSPFPVIVADCANPRDAGLIHDRGIVAEVPYPTAEKYRFLVQGKTTGTLWLLPASSQVSTSRVICLPPQPASSRPLRRQPRLTPILPL